VTAPVGFAGAGAAEAGVTSGVGFEKIRPFSLVAQSLPLNYTRIS